eukprot:TRINITY_DN30179_c0_g1_i1.p1 TRINITY_DN30179_c0_g1~~TRINITY_DN30179_c0_g1_i1.p1  ORF type:complete len:345 (+),score=117.27 TRINITY_DN30179_c0_g1_i1:86-1120(+)
MGKVVKRVRARKASGSPSPDGTAPRSAAAARVRRVVVVRKRKARKPAAPSPPSPPPSAPPSPSLTRRKAGGQRKRRQEDEATTGRDAASFDPRAANPLDHCETPARCHEDIVPLLHHLAGLLQPGAPSSPSPLRLYDPYYCDGRVAANFAALGFPNVYNRPEDFYAVAAAGQCPPHDVLVTNPPYSDDHIEKALRFCLAGAAPFALLVPNWVERKEYWEALVAQPHPRDAAKGKKHAGFPRRVFTLQPLARYEYQMPSWAEKPDHVPEDGVHSPFVSSWFIGVGDGCPLDVATLFEAMDAAAQGHRGGRKRRWVVTTNARSGKYKLRKQLDALGGRHVVKFLPP